MAFEGFVRLLGLFGLGRVEVNQPCGGEDTGQGTSALFADKGTLGKGLTSCPGAAKIFFAVNNNVFLSKREGSLKSVRGAQSSYLCLSTYRLKIYQCQHAMQELLCSRCLPQFRLV